MLLGFPLGFVWGAVTGGSGALMAQAMGLTASMVFGGPELLVLMTGVAGLAGALQFGLLWFPYTFQTVRRGRRWPLVVGAVLVTPVLGWAAVFSFFFLVLAA